MARPPRAIAIALWATWTALAAWVSLGTIGYASLRGARIGLLPLSPASLAIVVLAAAAAALLLRAGAPGAPLSLLALSILPWIPAGVPAAFLIWSGPAAGAVWVAVALMLVRGMRRPGVQMPFRSAPAPLRAGLVAMLLFGAAAWRVAPSIPGGDEPHYLIITLSLLRDGDLKIENNHRDGEYRAFHGRDLTPQFQRRGQNGEIYSIHAPGLAVLVLPAFAIAGYPGVVVFLVALAAAGSALAWWVAWLATRRSDAAWFGWAAVTFPVTAVFHSFTVYPDGPGGVFALTGVWALLRTGEERRSGSARIAPWFWHGAALAVLPWLHSRFAVIAAGLGAVILLRLSATTNAAAKGVAFLSVPAASAVLWGTYFFVLYGRLDPAAPYASGEMGSLAWVPGGLGGLLFDQRFGVLTYAPVLAAAIAGLGLMVQRRDLGRLGLELAFVMVPYLIVVTHFAMWWGGWSPPARFFAPVLPLLAVPAAACWTAIDRRSERVMALAALTFTVLATAALAWVDRGRLAFNVRDTPALWLEWLSKTSDLPQALPWWTRAGDAAFFRDIAVWLAAAVVALLIARAAMGRRAASSGTPQHVATAWALAAAMMCASTLVWAARRVDGRSVVPAQLQLLRLVASRPPSLVWDLEHGRRLLPADVPRHLRIELTRPRESRGTVRTDDDRIFEVPLLPAGEYLMTPVADASAGSLSIAIGRSLLPIQTAPVAASRRPIPLRFPVPVRSIVVRADAEARQHVSGLVIEPVVLTPESVEWPLGRRAALSGAATVFFLDERTFSEPDGFWVAGGGSSAFVLQPGEGRPAVEMLMRNDAPAANQVTLHAGGERTRLDFGPGEERRVQVPIDASRGAALVTVHVTGGFRPSDHDPASRDTRFLGIWIRVRP